MGELGFDPARRGVAVPVCPTYPGIYIEEVLSNAHTIAAAPTSIAVFIGYTHPFRTRQLAVHQAASIYSWTGCRLLVSISR
jgi:hypothetical protein